MYKIVAKGWHLVPGVKDRQYSLIHAADLAYALMLVAGSGERLPGSLESDVERGRGLYYAASDVHPTYDALGPLLSTALGRKVVRIIYGPRLITWSVAFASQFIARLTHNPTILNLDKFQDSTAGSWICSPAKVKSQLGFKTMKSLDERLSQTGEWYLEQGWL